MYAKLSIIIPAYNEEKRLPLTLARLFAVMGERYKGPYEVIVADDGSTDGTAREVEKEAARHPELRLVSFAKNRGRGAVVRDGVLKEASGDFILQMDADGSTEMEAIPRFVSYLTEHADVDILTGSRTIAGAKILTPQPFLRVALGNCFLGAAKIMFGWPMVDRINGFKMFRRAAALDSYVHQFSDHYIAEAEIVFVAERRGWRMRELPILWTDYRDSRIKPLRDSWRSMTGMARILINNRRGLYSRDLPLRRI